MNLLVLQKLVNRTVAIIRIAFGIFFIASGALKAISPTPASGFIEQIFNTSAAISGIITIFLSLFEIVIGVLLMTGCQVVIATTLASSFLVASSLAGVFFLSNPISCGCFGNFLESKTDEFFLLRNFFLLLMSLVVFKNSIRIES